MLPTRIEQANICWWFIMPDFSLVPVDHQPEFEDLSLVPVVHDPFGTDGADQQAQTQQAQAQPQSPPQQPATGADQPNVNAPAIGNGVPGESSGDPIGGDAGAGPNPTSDQGGAEPAPFGGYANPTPTESLVTKAKLDEFAKKIEADPTGKTGSDFEGGKSYRFVTTKPAVDPHQTDLEGGLTFVATSPFYVHDGARYATFDASPERPVRVTVTSDNKLTIGPP